MEQIASFLTANFRYFGLAGTLLIALGVTAASLGYTGKRGEPYSLLNHFISELGEVGVSRRAWAFNAGMIAGGLLLLPFQVGLGLALGGALGLLGMLAGLWASVSAVLVGVFPMNNLVPHSRAAMSFFRSGLVMVILSGIAVLLQPAGQAVVPPLANFFSLLAMLSYSSFLLLSGRKQTGEEMKNNLDPTQVAERPSFWLLTAVEWAVFFTTVLWLFSIAILR